MRLVGYDACAPTATTDETGARTTTTRDGLLRPLVVTDALGQRWRTTYDADGLPVSATDPLGHVATGSPTTRRHGSFGCTDAAQGVSRFYLNPRGALFAYVPPGRDGTARTMFTRNTADEVIAVDDPVGHWVSFTRDALGRVTRTTTGRGGRVDDAFDADGFPTSRKHDDVQAVAFGYDGDGALVSATAAGVGSTQFARDAEGRVLAITYPDGATARATYDGRGNRATLTYPSGLAVNYSVNAVDRVTRVAWAGASVDLQRDAAGRITGITRSNGVASSFTLDALGRIARVVHGTATRTIVDLSIERDAAGNVTARARR